MKKTLSLLLVFCMLISIFCPLAVSAADTSEAAITPTINKTNDGLDENDCTNVTLSVPGDAEVLGSDIIYIVGSYATNSDGSPNIEGDVLISSLVETIAEMVDIGTHVNFGMVPFSSDNVVAMPLTKIDEENIDALPTMIADALATCETVYDGVNMENALIKCKKMFSESELADHPERQHLVMISSGFTYFFNSGENNENAATVPVNYTGVNRLFYWNKAWQRARTNQTNTYPIPKAIVDAYNKTSKTVSLWDFYWSYIDQWAKQDIAAGDKVVYDACTIESGNFINWYNSGELVSGYSQTGYGKAVPASQVQNINDYVTLTAGANPLTNANAAHAIGYERAMWEAYEYTKENITGAGINFYPIYNALNVNYTNGNWSPSSYGVSWTNQYIGHSFVDMLAGGEGKAIKYDTQGDKTFFDPIKNKILYYCSVGSYVEDYIGYDAKNRKDNFEFIQNPEYVTMTVGGVEYTTTQIDAKAGFDFSLAFTAPGATEPTFWFDYTYGNGKTTEKFIWTFGENVSRYNPASLTYKLLLTEKAEWEGIFTPDTNISATLYPKDSEGNELEPEIFPIPKVEYEVTAYEDVDIVIALGAGIANKQNTYDSIVSLVKPLIDEGITVKLGLIAVEHYDDVAMELTPMTADNYEAVITNGLNTIINMPAGPTNLHGNIMAAKAMLDADESVPKEHKFFYVIATGRTYNFDNANGVPTTIINKVDLKGSTYYYWGHYLWQSQRGGHTSLYMIPARYNNDFEAYWADVCKWVEADSDQYAYSFTDAYDPTNSGWYVGENGFFTNNTDDAKALGLASSRFGWILKDLTNSGLAAIGSESNPQNALNYERAQYEAWVAYNAMKDAGYTCYALCSESTSYQNASPYIQVAGYTGTSTIQLGHSFMNFLAGGEAKVLFNLTDPNTGASEMAEDFFEKVDITKLIKKPVSAPPVLMAAKPAKVTMPKVAVKPSISTDINTDINTELGNTGIGSTEGGAAINVPSTFALTSKDGELLEMVETEDGSVQFTAFDIDAEGSYGYRIYQVSDPESGIGEEDKYIEIKIRVYLDEEANKYRSQIILVGVAELAF